VKYRGTLHGTNEYPFLIDEEGISILPVTSLGLSHGASNRRLSSGIPRLDQMLGGKGYYEGSTILISGTAGTGKTSVAAMLTRSACEQGRRVLYFAFEESPDQLVRNMRSVGVDLQPMLDDGRLRIAAARPTVQGLEMHLVAMHKAVNAFQPAVVVLDPITNLISVGTTAETKSMLVRLVDFLKLHGITGFFTSLTSGGEVAVEETEVGISSLIDTWLLLSVVRAGGERNRTIAVIKSRGMSHSNQATEYRITSRGLELMDTYLGPSGVLTGSARLAKEAEDRTVLEGYREELALREQERRIRQRQVDARIAGLQEELAVELAQIDRQIRDVTRRRERLEEERRVMSKSRQAFASPAARGHNKRDRS